MHFISNIAQYPLYFQFLFLICFINDKEVNAFHILHP